MILDQDYLTGKGISQSHLKKILIHPKYFANNTSTDFDEPAEVTLIGDGADLILTQGEDVFNEQIAIATVERPSAMLGDYVWALYKYKDEGENAEFLAYKESGYKISLDKVRDKFEKEGLEYYNQLLESENKKLITPKQYESILGIVESFKTHPFTSELFISNKYERAYQVPLYGKWKNFETKGLLDMLAYSRKENTVYPYDIKTTSKSLLSFEDTIFGHRYDFQAAFYMELINSNIGLIKNTFNCKATPTIAPFRFVVENQTFYGNPLIFEMSEEALNIGRNGGVRNGRTYEGFSQAFDRLKYHTENDLWEYRKEDYIASGIRIV